MAVGEVIAALDVYGEEDGPLALLSLRGRTVRFNELLRPSSVL